MYTLLPSLNAEFEGSQLSLGTVVLRVYSQTNHCVEIVTIYVANRLVPRVGSSGPMGVRPGNGEEEIVEEDKIW